MPRQEFTVSHVKLPRHLSGSVFKLHLFRLSLGLMLLAQGISSICYYGNNIFIVVVGASLFSSFAGTVGSLAIRKKSLVLHVGTLFVSAISFYLSLLAYTLSTAATIPSYMNPWLILATVVVLAVDMIVAVFNVGIEIAVIYVGVSHYRGDAKDNPQETGEI